MGKDSFGKRRKKKTGKNARKTLKRAKRKKQRAPTADEAPAEEASSAQSAPSAPKQRWSGNIEDLVNTLKPHITKIKGLDYGEELQDPMAPKKILKQKELIQKIQKMVDNMSIKETDSDKAMRSIADELNKAWCLPDFKVKEWAETQSKRLRLLLRRVQQGRLKPKPPYWIEELGLPTWKPKKKKKVLRRKTSKQPPEEPSSATCNWHVRFDENILSEGTQDGA